MKAELSPLAEIRKEDSKNIHLAQHFYETVEYSSAIQKEDIVFSAYEKSKIIGVVRIAPENGHLVLRGMMVDPSTQRRGIGSLLLDELEKSLGTNECFCLPYGWLEKFYGQIGFVKVRDEELPKHLQDRLRENRKKYPHLMGMRRAAGALLGHFGQIKYYLNRPLSVKEIALVYDVSGLKRPTSDLNRIAKMFENSNLIVSAWDKNALVGVSRALTDFSYCCYLSDLAVKKDWQKLGIGKKLIELTKKQIGPESMLLLLSVPEAMEYYPKVGFKAVQNGFIIGRER